MVASRRNRVRRRLCRTRRRGKLTKKDLRDKYRDYRFANAEAMVGRD